MKITEEKSLFFLVLVRVFDGHTDLVLEMNGFSFSWRLHCALLHWVVAGKLLSLLC